MLKAKHHLSQRKRDNSTIVCSLCSSFPFITALIKTVDNVFEMINNSLNPLEYQSFETTLEWRISKLKIADIKINTSILLTVCISCPVRRKITPHLTYKITPILSKECAALQWNGTKQTKNCSKTSIMCKIHLKMEKAVLTPDNSSFSCRP